MNDHRRYTNDRSSSMAHTRTQNEGAMCYQGSDDSGDYQQKHSRSDSDRSTDDDTDVDCAGNGGVHDGDGDGDGFSGGSGGNVKFAFADTLEPLESVVARALKEEAEEAFLSNTHSAHTDGDGKAGSDQSSNDGASDGRADAKDAYHVDEEEEHSFVVTRTHFSHAFSAQYLLHPPALSALPRGHQTWNDRIREDTGERDGAEGDVSGSNDHGSGSGDGRSNDQKSNPADPFPCASSSSSSPSSSVVPPLEAYALRDVPVLDSLILLLVQGAYTYT